MLFRLQDLLNRSVDALQILWRCGHVPALDVGQLCSRYTRDLAYRVTWDARRPALYFEIRSCHCLVPKDFLLSKNSLPSTQGEKTTRSRGKKVKGER
jgi:hypothetical protein